MILLAGRVEADPSHFTGIRYLIHSLATDGTPERIDMPREKVGLLTKIEVTRPITIRAIERQRLDADGPWAAVRVRFDCAVEPDCGTPDPGLLKALIGKMMAQ